MRANEESLGEALSRIQPGWTPSRAILTKAKRTGEIVTPNGYKLLLSQSHGWVGQLPLAFREIKERTP